jgi:hypothetical protein
MARKVFFSFHHKGDVGRIGQVRNSWLTKGEDAGYVDEADWESIKRLGDDAIKRWINTQLDGTSVTVVLIGNETSERSWVQHEIRQSHEKGNGLLGIYIHSLKDFRTGSTTYKGNNPFQKFNFINSSRTLADVYPVYDWVIDNGYQNLGGWIEEAAKKAGK